MTAPRGYLADLAGVRFIIGNDGAGGDDSEQPERAQVRFIGFQVADNPELGTTDITAPDAGGSSPLYLDYYYDSHAAAGGNGSYSAPFSTLAGLNAALEARPIGEGYSQPDGAVVHIAPLCEFPDGLTITTGNVHLVATGGPALIVPGAGPGAMLPAATLAAYVVLQGFTLDGNIDAAGDLYLIDCRVSANEPALTINGALRAKRTRWEAQTIASIAGTVCELEQCRMPAASTIVFTDDHGTLYVDAYTNYWWKQGAETLTNGSKTLTIDTAA